MPATGGGSGLGKATCKRLAAEAARVIVADMNVETAQAVAAAIQETGGLAEAAQVHCRIDRGIGSVTSLAKFRWLSGSCCEMLQDIRCT